MDLYFTEGKSERIFAVFFADHQVDYIVSASFYVGFKILHSASLQRNLQMLCPSKISVYTIVSVVTIHCFIYCRDQKTEC